MLTIAGGIFLFFLIMLGLAWLDELVLTPLGRRFTTNKAPRYTRPVGKNYRGPIAPD